MSHMVSVCVWLVRLRQSLYLKRGLKMLTAGHCELAAYPTMTVIITDIQAGKHGDPALYVS
jgi:hypothetical protein